MCTEKIAFDYELSRGIVTYNELVGCWWYRQAANPSHRYAYRNIARYIQAGFPHSPGVVVDYACGAGNLLAQLARRFPESRLIGFDGSSYLLNIARNRLARLGLNGLQGRVRLVETALPNFDLPHRNADLVVFAFPNIVPSSGKEDLGSLERCLCRADLLVGKDLARGMVPGEEADNDWEVLYSDLLRDRLVSRNMRGLLKRGGICLRVEYGNVRREELPRLELLRTGFEEGSLEPKVNGRSSEQWFQVLASSYFRSRVMEDVYHQSQDESDKNGGYFITVLRAV